MSCQQTNLYPTNTKRGGMMYAQSPHSSEAPQFCNVKQVGTGVELDCNSNPANAQWLSVDGASPYYCKTSGSTLKCFDSMNTCQKN